MKSLPLSVVETWLFLAKSNDTQLAPAKFRAYQHIRKQFGSMELARLYIEQQKDEQIEVVVI